jgi:hypothetical protein
MVGCWPAKASARPCNHPRRQGCPSLPACFPPMARHPILGPLHVPALSARSVGLDGKEPQPASFCAEVRHPQGRDACSPGLADLRRLGEHWTSRARSCGHSLFAASNAACATKIELEAAAASPKAPRGYSCWRCRRGWDCRFTLRQGPANAQVLVSYIGPDDVWWA